MLKISVDEADAFDRLSIGRIKCLESYNRKEPVEKQAKLMASYLKLFDELLADLGADTMSDVIHSIEYEALMDANRKLFQLIDESKTRPMTAATLDHANHERYIGKQKLQEKFFKNPLTEAKIGYGHH